MVKLNTNNAILLTFLFIFLSLAVVSPLVAEEFNQDVITTSVDDFNVDNLDSDITSTTALLFNLILIPFWTFGLPVWLNLTILGAMRIVFIVILYDKFRAIN